MVNKLFLDIVWKTIMISSFGGTHLLLSCERYSCWLRCVSCIERNLFSLCRDRIRSSTVVFVSTELIVICLVACIHHHRLQTTGSSLFPNSSYRLQFGRHVLPNAVYGSACTYAFLIQLFEQCWSRITSFGV